MGLDTSDDRINMLLGKKENPELTKVLGKKFNEDKILGREKDDKKIVKCPECGHEFGV